MLYCMLQHFLHFCSALKHDHDNYACVQDLKFLLVQLLQIKSPRMLDNIVG